MPGLRQCRCTAKGFGADIGTDVYYTRSSRLEAQVMAAVKGKVVEGGRIIVPAAFRKSMGLSKGDTVFMELHGDVRMARLQPGCGACCDRGHHQRDLRLQRAGGEGRLQGWPQSGRRSPADDGCGDDGNRLLPRQNGSG